MRGKRKGGVYMPDLNQNIQAPVWMITYTSPSNDSYKMMIVNWKCDIDAADTYWAVSQFSKNGTVLGYAGFKNDNGNHNIILSLWNINSNYPEVEYISPYGRINDLTFGSEGKRQTHCHGLSLADKYLVHDVHWYEKCCK